MGPASTGTTRDDARPRPRAGTGAPPAGDHDAAAARDGDGPGRAEQPTAAAGTAEQPTAPTGTAEQATAATGRAEQPTAATGTGAGHGQPGGRQRQGRRGRSGRGLAYLVGAGGLALVAFALRDLVPAAPSGPGPQAAATIAAAVNAMASSLGRSEHAIAACGSSGTAAGLACLQAQDRAMSATLRGFERDVAGTTVPAADHAADVRLQATVRRLAADLQDLAGAADSSSYTAIAGRSGIAPLGAALATQAGALVGELRRS